MRALPGDAATILGGMDANAEQIAVIRERLGLAGSLAVQYSDFMGGIVQGDLGDSLRERRPVTAVLLDRLPVTLALAGMAFVLSLVIGIGLGLLAGLAPGSIIDRFTTLFATAALALPEVWLRSLLILLVAVNLGWFPVLGLPPSGLSWQASWHLLLPAFTLALPRSAQVARLTRAQVLEQRMSDYVRTARSKGLHPRGV